MSSQSLAQNFTTSSMAGSRKDIKMKKGDIAPNSGWLVHDDGYKYLRAEDERTMFLEADLYNCNNARSTSSTNYFFTFALAFSLGAAAAYAFVDHNSGANSIAPFLIGGGSGAILVWSFQ